MAEKLGVVPTQPSLLRAYRKSSPDPSEAPDLLVTEDVNCSYVEIDHKTIEKSSINVDLENHDQEKQKWCSPLELNRVLLNAT